MEKKPSAEELLRLAETAADLEAQDLRPTGGAVAPDVFGIEDLLAPRARAEEFTMPGGKRIWVHALDFGSVMELNWLAAADLDRMEAQGERERSIKFQFLAKLYQVVFCARTGPEVSARRIFNATNADLLQRSLPWETVDAICKLSDRLGAENAGHQEALCRFFGSIASWAQTCASRLNADSLDACRAALTAFAGCASGIARHGMPAAGIDLPPLE